MAKAVFRLLADRLFDLNSSPWLLFGIPETLDIYDNHYRTLRPDIQLALQGTYHLRSFYQRVHREGKILIRISCFGRVLGVHY